MKRTIALMIAVLMLLCAALSVSVCAADTTDPAYIYFTPPTEGSVAWKGFGMVYCHMWSRNGGDVYGWQEKNEKCEDLGNGYWRYDVSGIDFDPEGEYSLIFSNENGLQTYNLNVTSSCLGDIAYCDGKTEHNPVDGQKQCAIARWKNNTNVHPAVEVDSEGTTINVDGVDVSEIETKWGTNAGASHEMEVIASAETKAKADDKSASKVNSASDEGDANPDGINLTAATTWIIIVSVIFACAIIVVVIILSKKNKKNG